MVWVGELKVIALLKVKIYSLRLIHRHKFVPYKASSDLATIQIKDLNCNP